MLILGDVLFMNFPGLGDARKLSRSQARPTAWIGALDLRLTQYDTSCNAVVVTGPHRLLGLCVVVEGLFAVHAAAGAA